MLVFGYNPTGGEPIDLSQGTRTNIEAWNLASVIELSFSVQFRDKVLKVDVGYF